MNEKERAGLLETMYGDAPVRVQDASQHFDIEQALEATQRGEPSILITQQAQVFLSGTYWDYVGKILDATIANTSLAVEPVKP